MTYPSSRGRGQNRQIELELAKSGQAVKPLGRSKLNTICSARLAIRSAAVRTQRRDWDHLLLREVRRVPRSFITSEAAMTPTSKRQGVVVDHQYNASAH
jgi:hypothetical protein